MRPRIFIAGFVRPLDRWSVRITFVIFDEIMVFTDSVGIGYRQNEI